MADQPSLTIPLPIPMHRHGRGFTLTQHVLDVENDEITMEVSCGAGLGGDHVELTYRNTNGVERSATFYLRDVLALWVETFDAEAAKGMPRITECGGCEALRAKAIEIVDGLEEEPRGEPS